MYKEVLAYKFCFENVPEGIEYRNRLAVCVCSVIDANDFLKDQSVVDSVCARSVQLNYNWITQYET